MEPTTVPGSAAFRKGYAHAQYQTAGLLPGDADTVRAWKRQVQAELDRARKTEKREVAKGLLRGFADWLTENS